MTIPRIKTAGAGARKITSVPTVSKNEVPRDSQRSLDGPLSFTFFRSIREISGRITRTPARLTMARMESRTVAFFSRQIFISWQDAELGLERNLTLLYVQ